MQLDMYSLSWYTHVVVDTVLQHHALLKVVLHAKNSKVYLVTSQKHYSLI